MDIKWVEDFLALVEHGSFTKAAEVRHVTQSGFSRRIRSLECSLGVDLVKRNVFPTTLTNAGEQNIESMKLLLNQYFDLQRKIEENEKQILNMR
ncbi:LysR family transcriptional regulator [uncultured Psychromonas sp.]|uniref:helix-turn-helix domain-containing protein n=1 Tax=uncultured Psychromonas sp. TaxID=173974 RepID=UPI002619E6D1|nr:LysR family transcriptional regulator [uncultured Psychromonas sp.]